MFGLEVRKERFEAFRSEVVIGEIYLIFNLVLGPLMSLLLLLDLL
jgi:hypothetical protein